MAKVKWNSDKNLMKNQDLLKKKLIALGFQIERLAKDNAPVQTGRLKASVSTNYTGSGMDEGKTRRDAEKGDGVKQPTGEFKVVVGTNVYYGPYIEFGTKHMAAQPFLRPAYKAIVGKFLKKLGKI